MMKTLMKIKLFLLILAGSLNTLPIQVEVTSVSEGSGDDTINITLIKREVPELTTWEGGAGEEGGDREAELDGGSTLIGSNILTFEELMGVTTTPILPPIEARDSGSSLNTANIRRGRSLKVEDKLLDYQQSRIRRVNPTSLNEEPTDL
ncbi:hypothetical protein DPEC_G00106850 [Dallia pectoralis]|uniref:Uncharacterized protein n=1 Tax=Dallia pectoralis TaxID=75939 RepID=A0ACC2GYE7_DALPE|nr:hypothetical protein DPEC_G00106850 [Dallia pectoralis]